MTPEIRETTLPPAHGIAVRATVPLQELPSFFAGAYGELAEIVRKTDAHGAGVPFARYHSAPPNPIDVELIMPLNMRIGAVGRARPVELPSGPALELLHVGRYELMGVSYEAIARYMKEHGLEASEAPREVYLTSPADAPDPEQQRTMIVQPVRRAP